MFGMECFVTNCEGFEGKFKQSWEDFKVREIDLDGKISQIYQEGYDHVDKHCDVIDDSLDGREPSSKALSAVKRAKFTENELAKPVVSTSKNLIQSKNKTEKSCCIKFEGDPIKFLHETLTESKTTELENLIIDKNTSVPVKIGFFEEKEMRTKIHQIVRYVYPQLKTTSSKNSVGQSEITVSTDPSYEDFLNCGLEKSNLDDLFRFVHCQMIIQNKSTFVIETSDNKEQRTNIHRLVNKNFGSFLESKSFIDKEEESSKINVRFRAKKRKLNDTLKPSKNGKEDVYAFTLCKKNVEMLDAINRLSNRLKMKPSQFSYAGVKDRKAVTFQNITVTGAKYDDLEKLVSDLTNGSLGIGNLRKVEQSLHLGQLNGNFFRIVIRDVKRKGEKSVTENVKSSESTQLNGIIETAISEVKSKGFINYYGSQRFGFEENEVNSADIGLAMIKGEMKRAVQLILTPNGQEDDVDKAKRYFQETNDVAGTLKKIPKWKTRECLILKALKQHGYTEDGCTNALFNLPYNTRLMYVHSYCSLIWNKVASARVKQFGLAVKEGDIVVQAEKQAEGSSKEYSVVTADDILCEKYNMSQVVLPLPGFKIKYPKNIEDVYERLLEEDNICSASFKVKKMRLNVPGAHRHLVSQAGDITWNWVGQQHGEESTNDVNKESTNMSSNALKFDAKDIELQFSLTASSYATVCLREIMKS